MPSGGHNRKSSTSRQSKRTYAPAPVATDAPEAPPGLTASGAVAFAELLAAIPSGTAARSDSLALGIAAELLAGFRESPEEFPAGKLATLRGLLQDFSLTPSARRKADIEPPPPENPFAAIDRMRNS